jgi:regulator of ribosome biosynthesis
MPKASASDGGTVTITPAIRASNLLPPTATTVAPSDLGFDLGNMCASDPRPVAPLPAGEAARDARLLATARDCTQLLANRLFALPTEPCDVGGVLAALPDGTAVVPRGKPVPDEGKGPETRWEKFAREKGIVKRKRGKMAYDEGDDKWKPRFGYGSAKNEQEKLQWAVEQKSNAPWPKEGEDPFAVEKNKKKAAIEKQKKHEVRNREEAAREQGRAGYTALTAKGLSKSAPPTVLRSEVKRQAKGALTVAQVSTGSIGKFDRRLPGESAPKIHTKRSRTELGTSAERDRNMGVMGKLFSKDELIDGDKAARVHMSTAQTGIAKQRSAPEKRGGKGKGAHKWTKGGTKRNRK